MTHYSDIKLYTNFWTYHRTGPYYPFWPYYQILRGLQRVRLANRGRLLLRTPGPVLFGTCICSNVETILSWTCRVYGPFEFWTSFGTSILLASVGCMCSAHLEASLDLRAEEYRQSIRWNKEQVPVYSEYIWTRSVIQSQTPPTQSAKFQESLLSALEEISSRLISSFRWWIGLVCPRRRPFIILMNNEVKFMAHLTILPCTLDHRRKPVGRFLLKHNFETICSKFWSRISVERLKEVKYCKTLIFRATLFSRAYGLWHIHETLFSRFSIYCSKVLPREKLARTLFSRLYDLAN